MTVWLATGNIHKKKELSEILSNAAAEAKTGRNALTVELKVPADVGLAFDPEETGSTFLENALIKAAELYRLLGEGQPVIADDSGICVDALDGRPGIYSARYGGVVTDSERNRLLLAELGGNPLRGARFVCAMVLYCGADRFFAAQETMEGELVLNAEFARGAGGFGYDPILYIPELGRTVAELSEEEKNRLSHRGKAGRVIGRILLGLDIQFISKTSLAGNGRQ